MARCVICYDDDVPLFSIEHGAHTLHVCHTDVHDFIRTFPRCSLCNRRLSYLTLYLSGISFFTLFFLWAERWTRIIWNVHLALFAIHVFFRNLNDRLFLIIMMQTSFPDTSDVGRPTKWWPFRLGPQPRFVVCVTIAEIISSWTYVFTGRGADFVRLFGGLSAAHTMLILPHPIPALWISTMAIFFLPYIIVLNAN